MLSEDFYLLEGLQQKRVQKQSYKTHPLLPETEATLMFVYFRFYTLLQMFTKLS